MINNITIGVPDSENGTTEVSIDETSDENNAVITTSPKEGYEVERIHVVDKNGKEIAVTRTGENTYTFPVSAKKAAVITTFRRKSVTFTDVKEGQYFYDAVNWGAENTVIAGYRENDGSYTFRPNDNCTRAQFVTFLWRTLGEQNSTSTANPFKDIGDIGSQYYGTALLWAYENHYVSGYSDPDGVRFGPDDQINRGQVVTFLWRAAGEPKATTTKSPFKDVTNPEEHYYGQAMLWASENGIVSGYSDPDGARFAPDDSCTRGQVVTFLWRYAQKYLK